MANYGDVALNLSPNWSRQREMDKKFALRIVGHENGKSDAALKDEPEKRHQFAWIDPRHFDELALNLSNGFEYVTKDRWDINEKLWQWNAEGKCLNGVIAQLLMARSAALWFAQQAERERELGNRRDEDQEAALAIAERAGIPLISDDAPSKRKGFAR